MATSQPTLFVPARPYRDFLTPSLHRRFTNAAILSLALCYTYAVVIGEWDPFWQWFPFGTAGVRTAVLFVPTLAIFVLRLAQVQLGTRTSPSAVRELYQHIAGAGALYTVFWYSFSAWWFCEATIWSASYSSKLGVVDYGMPYERARLNERPLFYRTLFQILALAQAGIHLIKDYDHIAFPIARSGYDASKSPRNLFISASLLKPRLVTIAKDSLFWTVSVAFVGPIIYTIFLRRAIWDWALWAARPFADLPKAAIPSTIPPLAVDIFAKFLIMGFLLMCLWGFVNAAFDVFLVQPPLKKDQPLTADAKDPNGSLLAGLKAKKQLPRNFAFFELAIIADAFQDRRASIYRDLDRKDGPAWTQMMAICLGELHAIVKRIQDFQTPPVLQTQTAQSQQKLHTLPKISPPLRQDNIVKPPIPSSNSFGDFAKAHGQHPGADPISPRAKKLLMYGADAVLSKEQQQHLSKGNLEGDAKSYVVQFLRSLAGVPFRQTFARRAKMIVLGTPLGNQAPIINAISSLRKLCVSSKKEDDYGRVHKDIPNIIRTFASTCSVIDEFLEKLQPHWSDVEFTEAHRYQVGEIEAILAALRSGLTDLINEFGEYADALGISQAEMRAAKEAVARRESG